LGDPFPRIHGHSQQAPKALIHRVESRLENYVDYLDWRFPFEGYQRVQVDRQTDEHRKQRHNFRLFRPQPTINAHDLRIRECLRLGECNPGG
jgi:hypothetical protein